MAWFGYGSFDFVKTTAIYIVLLAWQLGLLLLLRLLMKIARG